MRVTSVSLLPNVLDHCEHPAPTTTLPPPPPPNNPNGELTRYDAVRFLNQTSFGATTETVDALMAMGSREAWIEDQFSRTPSLTQPYTMKNGSSSLSTTRHDIWWKNGVEGEDQLRQRVAFALSEIFVISDEDYVLSNSQYSVTNYYDMLSSYADGNFRELLEAVTLHPVMGVYLSHLRNERADVERNIRPDENFARELMQLFTIGLYELTPDGQVVVRNGEPVPTFDQETVENFARIFTGWNFNGIESFTSNNIAEESYRLPMTPVEAFHDKSSKQLLSGLVTPANQSARQDLEAALDNIFNHPNVGPFFGKLMIQRLVTSNPTPAYVGRVAQAFNNNGQGVRGDMAAMITAIVTDPEATDGHRTLTETFGKVKEPLIRILQVWRAFNVIPRSDNDRYRLYAEHLPAIDQSTGQAPLQAPSIFNFFVPGYRPPGSAIAAPEMQIYSEANLAKTSDLLFGLVFTDNADYYRPRPNMSHVDFGREIELAQDLGALCDHLNELLFAGTMSPGLRSAIETQLAGVPTTPEGRYQRAVSAIFACVGSPSFMVQA